MRSSTSILVIEDEPNLRCTLAMILQRAGYTVTAASHARDALRLVEARAYDLVLLDVDRIEPGDTDLLAAIYRLSPALSLLILTASPAMETMGGADWIRRRICLVKPVDPARILACIHDILDPPISSIR